MNVKKQSFRNKFLPLVLVTLCALGATQEAAALSWMRVLTLGLYGGEASQAPQQATVAQPTVAYATQTEMATLASRLGQLEQTRNQTSTITNAKDLLYIAALGTVCVGLYKVWRNFTDCPSREDLQNTESNLRAGQQEHTRALAQARQELQNRIGQVQQNQEKHGQVIGRVERNQSLLQQTQNELQRAQAQHGQELNRANLGIESNTDLLGTVKAIVEGHGEHLSSIQTDTAAARASIAEILSNRETDQQRLTVRLQELSGRVVTIGDRLNTHQTLLERIDQNTQGVRRLEETAETADQEPTPSSIILAGTNMARNGSSSMMRDRRAEFSAQSPATFETGHLGQVWRNNRLAAPSMGQAAAGVVGRLLRR